MNLKKVYRILTNKRYRVGYLNSKGYYNNMPDDKFLKMRYELVFKKPLDLENPKTFNEKLQWLKLYDRKPIYTKMVDKYEVKQYVADRIGEEYIIPTLGVWDRFDDIDFDALPDQFVLKCTHDSGGLSICRDKSTFDKKAARKKLGASLKRNYYYANREWPYKNVKPRIIAEKYLDLEGEGGVEYKLFCSYGEVKIILLCKGKAHSSIPGSRTNDFFDEQFNHLPVINLNPNSKEEVVCPEEMDHIKELAKKLSENIPIVRVDFYLNQGKIHFGELTFFHNSGMCPFEPEEYDRIFGDMITLPQKD